MDLPDVPPARYFTTITDFRAAFGEMVPTLAEERIMRWVVVAITV